MYVVDSKKLVSNSPSFNPQSLLASSAMRFTRYMTDFVVASLLGSILLRDAQQISRRFCCFRGALLSPGYTVP
jgi:hypothetical protein